jgi:hypothetical protein
VLEIRPDGSLWIWDESCESMPVQDEFYAVGTGGVSAMCLMKAGLSPTEALCIVEQYDPATGGPFVKLTLEE